MTARHSAATMASKSAVESFSCWRCKGPETLGRIVRMALKGVDSLRKSLRSRMFIPETRRTQDKRYDVVVPVGNFVRAPRDQVYTLACSTLRHLFSWSAVR